MREQEVNSEILSLERSSVERDLSGLNFASGNIERLVLKLDDGDPHKFLATYARIGEIKERILNRIPELQVLKKDYDEKIENLGGTLSAEIEAIEEKPIDLLIQEEAAVIAAFLAKNKNMLTKHGFENFPGELAEKLGLGVELKLDKIELNRFRIKALEHLRELLSSDHLEKIYDNHNPDIQSLFVYFVDREKALDLLEELLSVDIELSWRIAKGEVVDVIPIVYPKRPEEADKPQKQLFEVREIPLVLEVLTPLESGALRIIVDQLSQNRKLSFLELQGVMYRLAVEVDLKDRFRSFGGKYQFRVFRPEEAKKSFLDAFRKLRFPGVAQGVEDLRLLGDLGLVMEDVCGGDGQRFQRSIGVLIDNAERDFYSTYQPASGEKVIWLDIDRLGA